MSRNTIEAVRVTSDPQHSGTQGWNRVAWGCVPVRTRTGTMHHQVMTQTPGIIISQGVYPDRPNKEGIKQCVISIWFHPSEQTR
jgi:hypothetical protein